jgi:SAM-dependent methyltransferase
MVSADGEYGRFSQYRDTAGLDPARGRELALSRLELRGRADDEVAARREYLDLLGLAPGERVLDVGCGSGVVTRDIARRVGPDGRVIGLDASPAFLAVARDLAREAGLEAGVEFREGDARALPFDEGAFDAVVAATALAHVPDGTRAIPEMVRVTRPGGRVGVFDFDGDSTLVSHPDRALTRRIIAALSDHAAVDSWLARRLPGLLARAGLRDIRARAFMPLDQDPAGFYASLAGRAAEVATQTGAITVEERRRWLEALQAEVAAGGGLFGRLHLFVWGRKPGGLDGPP